MNPLYIRIYTNQAKEDGRVVCLKRYSNEILLFDYFVVRILLQSIYSYLDIYRYDSWGANREDRIPLSSISIPSLNESQEKAAISFINGPAQHLSLVQTPGTGYV